MKLFVFVKGNVEKHKLVAFMNMYSFHDQSGGVEYLIALYLSSLCTFVILALHYDDYKSDVTSIWFKRVTE